MSEQPRTCRRRTPLEPTRIPRAPTRGRAPRSEGLPDAYAAAIICVLLVMFAGIAVMAHLVSEAQATDEAAVPEYKPTHDSMTYSLTYDGEMIRRYVMKDPDTQIEYLVNDRGGCCPRLDNYGNVMGLSYE